MATHPLQDFLRRLRRARSVAEGGHLTDAQLLERFAKQRDEAAFEVLVWRHGPLVLNLARRLLRQSADIEDVFQATFLTLARKASAIRRGMSVGSWLYKVAYRLALRVRQTAARHERRQQSGIETVAAPLDHDDAELAAILAEEVSRLPERLRAVVVLCYLQGTTTEEAARVLGCPRGTVLSRLAGARQKLRQRLLRRGIAPVIAIAAVSFGDMASAMPSAALVTSVVGAALPFAAGGASIPMVSTQAAVLARGALQMMMWNKIKIVGTMACILALAGSGAGWLASGRGGTETSPPVAAPPVKKEAARPAPPERQDNTEKEITKIHDQMFRLNELEDQDEAKSNEEMIEHRLRLLELQDELSLREETLNLRREERREKLKSMRNAITQLEKSIAMFAEKTPGVEHPVLKQAKQRKESLEKQIQELSEQGDQHSQMLRDIRRKIFHYEAALRHLESRRNRQREYCAAKRERLQARLELLENKNLDLEPADRLRDVERKLDALRRDVGELRRALERQKER